ncbi:MAG TPA: TonB-dependent receptor [Lysobacter sp.]|jgi:TonB-dependent receptor|nr:TonB-dependent receptor [Lysobacter sp.]
MQFKRVAKKTPVTILAASIGFALQMAALPVLAQDAPAQTTTTADSPEQTPQTGDATNLDAVTVTGYRASVERALDIKRGEAGVVDAIVAEDIGKFPDLNLAESLQRIPGVTITRDAGEGRNISVRGLSPQFTRVRINGMEALASTGATDNSGGTNRGRGFDFNAFASELFSQLIVRKTAAADIDEGSLGATVDLRTARPFDYDGFTASAAAQYGYNDLSEDWGPRFAGLISNTWADGKLGALLSVAYTKRELTEVGAGTGRWSQATANNGFDPTSPFTPALESTTMHPRFPRYIQQEHEQERLGLTASIQAKFTDKTEVGVDAMYATYDAKRTEKYIEAISFSRGRSQNGKPQTIVLDGELNEHGDLVYGVFDNVDMRSESRYDDATTTFKQINFTLDHEFSDDLRLNVMAGSAKSEYDKPTETTIIMDKDNVDGYSWDYRGNRRLPTINYGIDPLDPSGWTFKEVRLRPQFVSNSFENLQADLKWRITDRFTLKGGVQAKDYTFDSKEWRRSSEVAVPTFADGTTIVPVDLVTTTTIDGISAPGSQNYVIPDLDAFADYFDIYCNCGTFATSLRAANTLSIEEKDRGAYLMGDFSFDIGSIPFSGNVGVRYIETKQIASGIGTDANGQLQPVTVERTYDDTLPSFNLVAEITPDFLIRLAAAKVMARPGLGNLNPGVRVSVSGGARTVTGGDPMLDPFRATTGDLSFEWYFQEGALLGLGLFYKDIDSFVQNLSVTRPYSSSGLPLSLLEGTGAGPDDDFVFSIPVNTKGGPLKGAELNYQQPFSFLPGFWSNFGIQANYTYVDSQINYLDNTGAPTLTEDLTGLSRTSWSATLYYDSDVFSARVTATDRDDYLTAVPATDKGNDVSGTAGSRTVDASITYSPNEHWEFSLEGLNLTDEWLYTWNDSVAQRPEYYTKTGRQYLMGVRYKF